MSSSKRKSKDPDFLGAQIAIQRAASEALQLARLTQTACFVLHEGALINLGKGHFAALDAVQSDAMAAHK